MKHRTQHYIRAVAETGSPTTSTSYNHPQAFEDARMEGDYAYYAFTPNVHALLLLAFCHALCFGFHRLD